jgi:hypothetical protein
MASSASTNITKLLRALNAPQIEQDLPIEQALGSLRQHVLEHGIPPTEEHEAAQLRAENRTTLRGMAWMVLLGSTEIPFEVP